MRAFLPRLLLLAGAVTAALLIAEGAVRVLLPTYVSVQTDRTMWQHHPLYGWITRPGIEVEQGFGPASHVPVRINAHGFRGRDLPPRKQEGLTRLVVLGDSFVFGYGVAEEERFTEVLEASGRDLECANLGISGYSTDQELLVFRDFGRPLAPDVVVLVFVSNDPPFNESLLGHGFPKPRFVADGDELVLTGVPVPKSRLGLRLRHALVRRSALFNLVDSVRRGAQDRASRTDGARVPPGNLAGGQRPGLELTQRLIRRLRDEAEAGGARFMLLIAVSGANLTRHPPLNLEMAAWCRSIGMDCVDPYDDFVAEAARGVAAPLFLSDEHHWAAAGHRVVALRLLAELESRGWIGRE